MIHKHSNKTIQTYSLFPHNLGQTTIGELENRMRKHKGAKESDIKRAIGAIVNNGQSKNWVEITMPAKRGYVSFGVSYRLRPLSWWERNFVYDEPEQ